MKFLKQNKKVIVTLFLVVAALLFTYFFCDDNSRSNRKASDNSEIFRGNLEASLIESSEKSSERESDEAPLSEYAKNENVSENDEAVSLPENEKIDGDAEKIVTNEDENKLAFEKEEKATEGGERDGSEIYSENVKTEEENTVSDKKTEEKNENSSENVAENEKNTQSEKKYCTLSVECKNALGKSSDKEEILPSDGIIFPLQKVELEDGDSVFDILLREMKNHKIHLEFVNTPIFNSTYIEGIGNLYEFDCGDLSGWLYSVNGIFPDYGCSLYMPEDGDEIRWIYTCDLGKDAGAEYFTGNGRVQ